MLYLGLRIGLSRELREGGEMSGGSSDCSEESRDTDTFCSFERSRALFLIAIREDRTICFNIFASLSAFSIVFPNSTFSYAN